MTARLSRRSHRSLRWAIWLLLALAVGILIAGPELAPHTATEQVAAPFTAPSAALPLGSDHLGRDVASRVLHGGRAFLLTSVIAGACGTAFGTAAGLFTTLTTGRRMSALISGPLNAVAAAPPIMVLLLVLTALPNRAGLIVGITMTSAPLSARVTAAATAQLIGRAHLEAAVARGERWPWLIGREILPLIAATLVADLGMRFVAAVYLVAAAGFLGLATSDADWGRLIVEALPGAALQPWALLIPMAGVAVLAVGANLLADSLVGRSKKALA
ncbi:ABC transporter permease [Nocardia sp. NPDC058658]|uniref:ABC transporter permease n=1 Tax=Nocardia sp. NPDC058658 TaxID=3346580 RepID=UPI00365EF813